MLISRTVAKVDVAPILARHLKVDPCELDGETVRDVLEALFARHETLRGYVLDDQGALRQHVVVFVDGEAVRDLGRDVGASSEVVIMQALSGGSR